MRLGSDGIVRLSWAPRLEITGELAAAAVRIVDDLNGPIHRPMLVNMTGTAALTRSARSVFARPCSVSRLALLGRSAVDRVIANFALGVNRHPMPMRFFTDERAALDWLRDAAAER
ncbi:hypothetical protein [Actinomycetospora atypica]|uniref:DUF7793 family protein n=1 Tax=Actinomycetospora atypica TaxID=1290095 RepID=UPI00367319A7